MTAPSLRTYMWLAGSGFIVAASLAFVAYLRFHLPWWGMVLLLGSLVGGVVALMEWLVADPIEHVARGPGRLKDGTLVAPAPPHGRFAAAEGRKLWRAMRAFQEQGTQLRSAQAGVETRSEHALREARLLKAASAALKPGVELADLAPSLMRDLADLLGLPAIWLVPLRRHCPVPVLGPEGAPGWGEELRASGLAPWDELLVQDRPLALCLTDRAPLWRRHFAHEALWIFPLVYHHRAQGFLLARLEGGQRAWTPDELALMGALAPLLAAALHPPRWSEVRRRDESVAGAAQDAEETVDPPPASWLVALATPPEEPAVGMATELVIMPPEPVTAPLERVTMPPVTAPPEPVAVLPEPVAAPPEPVAELPEPVTAPPEPVAALPEPVTAPPELSRRERRRRHRAGA